MNLPARYTGRHFFVKTALALIRHSIRAPGLSASRHLKSINMKNTSGLLVRMAIVVLMIVPAISTEATPFLPFADTSVTKDPTIHYLRLNEVNAHAARDFIRRFPAITTEKWLRTATGYSAKFSDNDVLSNVYYDRAGHYINTIRYYEEKNIPAGLKNLLRSEFSDYTIVAATELIKEKEKSFYFHIKNRKRIKTVRIVSDTIEITADFRNAELDLQ